MLAQRGNVTIFIAIITPVMIAMLALIVNVGMLLYSRVKIQIAADRGAYAGAAVLAHALNQIAIADWKIHHEYVELEKWLSSTSERSKDEIKKRMDETKQRQGDLIDEINQINTSMFESAVITAQSVSSANYSGSEFMPFALPNLEGMFRIGLTEEEGAHFGDVSGANIMGQTFDPDSYEIGDKMQMLRYVEKTPQADVLFGGWVKGISPTPVMLNIFGESSDLLAAAAAQPYGGSISEFAQVKPDADEPPNVLARELLYRVAFVPVNFATDREPYALH